MSACRSRSSPASSVSSETARESRARPRPRAPKPSPGASATRASWSSLSQDHPSRELEPDEERPFATRRERGEGRDDPVATRLVQGSPLGHRLLRAGQCCDRRPLQRDEDPGAHVLLQPRHPRHELLVSEHESEPPARHAVALREREELHPDLARARLGEKALRPAAVEDEVAVREVVEDGSVRPVGEGDRLGEDAVRRRLPVGFDG